MKLNKIEYNTFVLLMVATIFNGLVNSLSSTQDIIAKKALHAVDWELTLLAMIWPVSNFFSIWWGRILERSQHKSRYFIIAGILGRLVLLAGLWIANMKTFLIVIMLMYSFNSLLIPAQNIIYQSNFTIQNRSKVYGYTISLMTLVAMIMTYYVGHLLDKQESLFKTILAVTGIAGFISSIVLSLIKIQQPVDKTYIPMNFMDVCCSPIKRTFQLMRENKQFAKFERSFSIYGLGFLMLSPILPIYMVEKLQLSYTSNFLAKGILSQLGLLVLSPLLGKWHDKMHPHRYIAISFGGLALFPLLLLLSGVATSLNISVALAYVAFFVFGIAMTGINIAWNMSSIYFAGAEDASMYQSVHVTLTGVRGLVAPLLGLLILRFAGIYAVFATSAGFLILAAFVSNRDARELEQSKQKKEPAF